MVFDARIVRKTNIDKQHGKGGSLFTSKISWPAWLGIMQQNVVIDVDGKQRTGFQFFSLSVGILQITVAEMMQAPDAFAKWWPAGYHNYTEHKPTWSAAKHPRLFNGTKAKIQKWNFCRVK